MLYGTGYMFIYLFISECEYSDKIFIWYMSPGIGLLLYLFIYDDVRIMYIYYWYMLYGIGYMIYMFTCCIHAKKRGKKEKEKKKKEKRKKKKKIIYSPKGKRQFEELRICCSWSA